MNEIFVTNTNDFDHQDRFDGQDFFFPKGERVTIPVIAAEHMFGLGRADKTENLIRCGWGNGPQGVKYLANEHRVQGRGDLVEEHYFRFHRESSNYGDTLRLPTG